MLTDYIAEDKVLLNVDDTSYKGVLLSMLEKSAETDGAGIVEKIFEREKVMPTALGKGLFLPRVILREKPRSEVIIAVNSKGLTFEDYGAQTASIIMLFLFSAHDDYGALLAQSLRLLTDDCLRTDLLKSKKPVDVIKSIREWEEE
jgi:mannitol/fructose-specific phosphotransferase system IIA component (Ntr-type)